MINQVLKRSNMKLIKDKESNQEMLTFLEVDEHSLYEVMVKTTKNNVKHKAFLFTGFDTGAYTYVYK